MEEKNNLQDSIVSWMSNSMHTFMGEMHFFARQNNLSIPQMSCLLKMKKKGPLQVNQVGHIFDMSKPAASQLLDKLVQRNLATREESSADRRIKYHSITPQGEDLLKEFFKIIKTIGMELDNKIPEEKKEDVRSNLEFLTSCLIEIKEKGKKEKGCSN